MIDEGAGRCAAPDEEPSDARLLAAGRRQLEAAAIRGQVLINDVVYADLSVGFLRIEEVDTAPSMARVDISPVPRAALFPGGGCVSALQEPLIGFLRTALNRLTSPGTKQSSIGRFFLSSLLSAYPTGTAGFQ